MFRGPSFLSDSQQDQKMIDELKEMSLEDKISTAKRNEEYAICLLKYFQKDLGGFDQTAFAIHESNPYYAKNDTKLVNGAYYYELANAHQNVKNIILASEIWRAKLAPSMLEDLQKTSVFSITGKK
jgi:hypothetical protein